MRVLTMALAALTAVAQADSAPASPMTFKFSGNVFQSDSTSESLFRVGTEVFGEFSVDAASFEAGEYLALDGVTGLIFGDGLFNHPLWSGFVLVSDNKSLVEPDKAIDEIIIGIADATADRPVAQGGHGMTIADPRGATGDVRFIGVRIRLNGPASWFDASAGPVSALAVLPDFQTAEAWAEFDDFVSNSRAYSDFGLTRLSLVPEPAGALLAIWAAVCGARRSPPVLA